MSVWTVLTSRLVIVSTNPLVTRPVLNKPYSTVQFKKVLSKLLADGDAVPQPVTV